MTDQPAKKDRKLDLLALDYARNTAAYVAQVSPDWMARRSGTGKLYPVVIELHGTTK